MKKVAALLLVLLGLVGMASVAAAGPHDIWPPTIMKTTPTAR